MIYSFGTKASSATNIETKGCTMSPDPTQQPIEETLTAPNLQLDARGMNDSDSEDDDAGMAGYVPLSQVPADSDPMLYEDDVCYSFLTALVFAGEEVLCYKTDTLICRTTNGHPMRANLVNRCHYRRWNCSL